MSPEQFLEVLGEEKDLAEMQRFSNMAYAKCMKMYSEKQLEFLTNGGAPPNGSGFMPFGQPGGLMNGF